MDAAKPERLDFSLSIFATHFSLRHPFASVACTLRMFTRTAITFTYLALLAFQLCRGSLYDTKPSILYFDVVEPSDVVGRIRVVPNMDGGSIIGDLRGVPLVIPNRLEADRTACLPFMYDADNGVPLNGSILLLFGSNCPWELQVANVQASGAIGWVSSYNIQVGNLIDALQGHPPVASVANPVWYVSMQYNDAHTLVMHMQAHPSEVVRVNVNGTVALAAAEHASLLEVARSFVAIGWEGDCSVDRCGNLMTFRQFVDNPATDPCLHRLMGLTCTTHDSDGLGHIQTSSGSART